MVRIEPFLLEDESLLDSCGTGRGLVCATDMRLLRVEHGLLGRRIRDLSYREISSVTIADRINWLLIAVGALMALGGFALPRPAPLLIGLIDPARPLRLTAEGAQSVMIAGMLVLAIGLGLVVHAVGRRRCYVGLEGPGLLRSHAQRRHWCFPTPTASEARVFAALVRGRLADRATVDGRKVLPHDAF